MKGFYLYCIRPRTKASLVRGKEKSDSGFSTEGIGGGEVFTIPYQDLEAVVSEVSLAEFGFEEIQRKAQEDLGWIKEKASLHEKVIEEAMGYPRKPPHLCRRCEGKSAMRAERAPIRCYPRGITAVIPMKFGIIFKTKEKLEESLKKYYSKFKQSLEDLAGKQEWAVKIYLNRKAFGEEIKKVSPVVQEKEKEIAQLPEGMAYFMQKQIDDVVSKEANKALEKYIESFFENLKKYAGAGTKGKILEKELTGESLPMILNAIFLVSEQNLEDFVKEVDKLNQEYRPNGFNFEYSGPWPPYHFV